MLRTFGNSAYQGFLSTHIANHKNHDYTRTNHIRTRHSDYISYCCIPTNITVKEMKCETRHRKQRWAAAKPATLTPLSPIEFLSVMAEWTRTVMGPWSFITCYRFHLKRLFSSPSNDYLVETPQLRHISHLWNSGTSVPPVADLGQIHRNGTGPQYTFTRQIALGSVYSVVSEEQKPAKIHDKICNVWDCAIQWPVINVKAELCA